MLAAIFSPIGRIGTDSFSCQRGFYDCATNTLLAPRDFLQFVTFSQISLPQGLEIPYAPLEEIGHEWRWRC